MGRHSLPDARFSLRRGLRFEPLEAAIAGVSFLAFAVGLPVMLSESSAIEKLRAHGRCTEAQVEDVGWYLGSRLRSTATLTYVIGQQRYRGVLHYQGDRALRERPGVWICTDRDDPTTFALDSSAIIGDSTRLWLRHFIGLPLTIAGSIVFGFVVGKHQWRFEVDDAPDS